MRLRRDTEVLDPQIERELAELEAEFGAELKQLPTSMRAPPPASAVAAHPPPGSWGRPGTAFARRRCGGS